MKYLLALVTSLALVLSPVYAVDAPSAPVTKGKLMLAKKKDHSQDNVPKSKKSKK
jgi:opacity protein-like surface antigen